MNTMTPHLLSAQHAGEYRLRLRFDDGTEAVVDLASELWGEVFEPLRDPAVFRQFRVHPEFHTLVWENGADFAPEFLHDNVRVTA